MIKIRRYGKTVLVNFENGKWTHVKSSPVVSKNVGTSSFYLTDSLISFFRQHLPRIKIPQLVHNVK
jgi:hypothetical protein